MKKYRLLIFLLLSFFACNDEDTFFKASTDGLKLDYRSVPGGAMLKYTLPNDRNIFSMNIRYQSNNGKPILKSCGYGGDSVLLDGFTQSQKASAQISFVDNYGNESKSLDFEFTTDDSAPWTFFNKLKISTSWSGFRVVYGSTPIATGMAHVFYLGQNPLTHKQDTILVNSFPINAKGDTLHLVIEQENKKNTVIVRTEDFAGYRVRQEIFTDVESFYPEKIAVSESDFNDGGLSIENENAKVGIKYLFDGELRGRERFTEARPSSPFDPKIMFGSYLAGPNALGRPFVIDLKKERVPAKLRMYALYEVAGANVPSGNYELGAIWNGRYKDKIPCNVTVYGSNDLSNPEGWVDLGALTEDPQSENPWSDAPEGAQPPIDLADFEDRDPIFIDINLPPENNTYRYLKLVVNDTYKIRGSTIDYNRMKYFTLVELEVFVKKD